MVYTSNQQPVNMGQPVYSGQPLYSGQPVQPTDQNANTGELSVCLF